MKKIGMKLLITVLFYSPTFLFCQMTTNDTLSFNIGEEPSHFIPIDTMNFSSAVGDIYVVSPYAKSKYFSSNGHYLIPGTKAKFYEFNKTKCFVTSTELKFTMSSNSNFKSNNISESDFTNFFWSQRFCDSVKQKYGPKNWKLIIDGEVKIGWSKELCELAWGSPHDINKTTNYSGTSEQWVYSGGYLYFTNGKLTTIQN